MKKTSAVANDEAELETLVDVLVQLGLAGISDMRWQKDHDQHRDAEAAFALKAEELERIRSGRRDLFRSKCILLPPRTTNGTTWVPMLWVHLEGMYKFSFQMAVFGKQRRFGYRWEYPVGALSGGVHSICHAQPISVIKRAGGQSDHSLNVDAQSVCENLPSFPLDAKSPLSLIGALLFSLYNDAIPKLRGDLSAKLLEGTHRGGPSAAGPHGRKK